MTKRVAICGVNARWNMKLFEAIQRVVGSGCLEKKVTGTTGFAFFRTCIQEVEWEFQTISGPFLYEEEAFTNLLDSAHAVVYTTLILIPKDDDFIFPYHKIDQQNYFDLCVKYIKILNVQWTTIPWVWGFTEDDPGYRGLSANDLKMENPIAEFLPNDTHVLHCSTRSTMDVQRLWSVIRSLV